MDTPKTIPQLHVEVERLELEIRILKLTAERDSLVGKPKSS